MTREFLKCVIGGMALMVALLQAACVSAPVTLEDLALDPDSNRLAVTRLEDGLLAVPVDVGLDEPVPFVLDTGATKSVVFSRVLDILPSEDTGAVRVHGMFGSEVVRKVRLPHLALGSDRVDALDFAVLTQRNTDMFETPPWGILGMDILSRYRLFSPGGGKNLILLEAKGRAPIVPDEWGVVELKPSPYNDAAANLRFMDVRLNGRMTTALLDTGSAVNILTYEFAKFPAVMKARRQLMRGLELQGAVDSVKPRVIIEGVDFRAGSRIWWDHTFIVRDVDALEALGVVGQPFMIAGVDILADETFYLDLAGGQLRMPRTGPPAGALRSRIGGADIQVGSEARMGSSRRAQPSP